MLNFVNRIFKTAKPPEYNLILTEIQKVYKHAPMDFGGACSYQKALIMAAFIKAFNLQASADIGVYRGRSLFPQAIAHKKYSKGVVYGIDPYDNAAAVQHDNPALKESLEKFVQTTDFNKMYSDVSTIISKHKFSEHCLLIRKKSEDAKSFFIDHEIHLGLIHIDGNHDTSFVIKDVADYLPIVQDGGIIVLDDISWDSVKPAFDKIKKECRLIGEIIDSENDFAIFIKNPVTDQLIFAEKIFNEVRDYNYPNRPI